MNNVDRLAAGAFAILMLAGVTTIAAITHEARTTPRPVIVDDRIAPPSLDGRRNVLPLCTNEDQSDCYWDARSLSNGLGDSFVDIGGTTYWLGN